MPKTQSRSRARNRSNTAESRPAARRNFVVRRQLELNLEQNGQLNAGESLVELRPRVIRLRELEARDDAGSRGVARTRGVAGSRGEAGQEAAARQSSVDSCSVDSCSVDSSGVDSSGADSSGAEASGADSRGAAAGSAAVTTPGGEEFSQVVLEPARRRVAVVERPTAPRRRIVLSRLTPDVDRTPERQVLTTRRLPAPQGDALQVRPLGSAAASVTGACPAAGIGSAESAASTQTEAFVDQPVADQMTVDANLKEAGGGRPPLLELLGFCATLFVFMAAAAWL